MTSSSMPAVDEKNPATKTHCATIPYSSHLGDSQTLSLILQVSFQITRDTVPLNVLSYG
jgi:hypothetical protein